jgi:hypothetical protein
LWLQGRETGSLVEPAGISLQGALPLLEHYRFRALCLRALSSHDRMLSELFIVPARVIAAKVRAAALGAGLGRSQYGSRNPA